MARVKGKIAIVTGASSGLGAADARRLAEEGAQVVLTDVNAEIGLTTASSIPGAIFLQHDVRDEARWKEIIAITVERFGGLHVLVNNAGVVRPGPTVDCTLEDFRFHTQVMLEGTFLGCKHAIPAITRSGGGSIINIASIGAIKGAQGHAAYAAAKGGIIGLSRSIGAECHGLGTGIRVNVVAPGSHKTPMTDAAINAAIPDQTKREKVIAEMGQPADVANMVLFLASDESRGVNGALIVVDHGETSW